MKTASWIALAVLALISASAHAAPAPVTQLVVNSSSAARDSEVAMKIDVELRTGVFAYSRFGSAELSFFGRENSTLVVNSKANTFEVVFEMKVAPINFDNQTDLLAIEILRTDSNEGTPTGHTHLIRSIIEKGIPAQVVVPGKFQGQRRDFRLTFHY